tara:strand:+ start:209 stop:610 length:402 start_codon:yes stop_codon:yes gene_type:complete
MNAKDLELKISGLEKAIEEKTADASRFQDELKATQKQLADVNKPELTGLQLDNIQEAIEIAVDTFDFDDVDNYDKEFELDYDGRVQLSNFDFTNTQELVEMIVEKVHKLFVEVEDEEDDNSQVNNATHVEKVI